MRIVMLSAAALSVILGVVTCMPSADVDHEGEYTLFPGVENVDTNIYALRHLLIVQSNVWQGQTIVYYFRGDLSAADLGFSDLFRLVRNFNRYDVVFTTPDASYIQALREQDDHDGELKLVQRDRTVGRLVALDNDALGPTGASRYLRSLETSDYKVEAFAGVIDDELKSDELQIKDSDVGFSPILEAAELDVLLETGGSSDDDAGSDGAPAGDMQLTLHPGPLNTPDYLIAELSQPIIRLEDLAMLDSDAGSPVSRDAGSSIDVGMDAGMDAGMDTRMDAGLPIRASDASMGDGGVPEPTPIDSVMRTRYLPELSYVVTAPLMARGFQGGCWSLEVPLTLRFAQVKRHYRATRDGDLAVIHQRFDHTSVPKDMWQSLLESPQPAAYCDAYTSYDLASDR